MNSISENIISFKRLSHRSCSSYKIYVKEYLPNSIKEYILDEVLNPKVSLDVTERKVIKYNEKQKWQLRDEITGVNSSSVEVFINHNKLQTRDYTFNVKTKVLIVTLDLNKDDIIEVEYKLDIICYSHKSQNRCEYTIVPIFENSHLIGTHNIL